MLVYRTTFAPSDATISYHRTLAEAHEAGRSVDPAERWAFVVELVDVPTDHARLVHMLNKGADSLPALRSWVLTRRGGLREELQREAA